MHILERIVEHKREEVRALKKKGLPEPRDDLLTRHDFRAAIQDEPYPNIIAEVKKASPSKGIIREDFHPVEIAKFYARGGASAVSVLTDERFFQGKNEYLSEIKRIIEIPVLRKDFIIDHIQVEEARLIGADAVLLIVACLEDILLGELMAHARELGLQCLVEVHDEGEAERALDLGADIIGINNRDLRDFSVSINTTQRIMNMLPKDRLIVSESGIGEAKAFLALKEWGVHGALIGEAFMRRPGLLAEFVSIR